MLLASKSSKVSSFRFLISESPNLDSEEFEDFQGFMRLSKIPSLNKFLSHPHETEIFGFKASKKRVHYPLFSEKYNVN